MSSILRIQFPKDFDERHEKYVARFKPVNPEIHEPQKIVEATQTTGRVEATHNAPAPKKEIEVGDLATFSDGSIRYKGTIVDLRPQLKELCRMFMRQPKKLLNADDIKDKIVEASKRENTYHATIAKYVSELHRTLKIHFKKDVIFNSNQDGWYLDTEKK